MTKLIDEDWVDHTGYDLWHKEVEGVDDAQLKWLLCQIRYTRIVAQINTCNNKNISEASQSCENQNIKDSCHCIEDWKQRLPCEYEWDGHSSLDSTIPDELKLMVFCQFNSGIVMCCGTKVHRRQELDLGQDDELACLKSARAVLEASTYMHYTTRRCTR